MPAEAKPNIILILTDQHRLSGVRAYGETPCRTPWIDRLADEGVLFRNAYTVYPVCSPARGTVMTGLYPHSHGITSNIHEAGCSVHELEDRPTLLPRRLQRAGYSTGYTGKWHLGTERQTTFGGSNTGSLPSSMGFEGQDFPGHGGAGHGYPEYREWLRQKGYAHAVKPWKENTRKVRDGLGELDIPTEASVPAFLVDKSIEMVEVFRTRDKPFFIDLNFWGPHGPYHSTAEFVDAYRNTEIPRWPNFDWPSQDIPGPHHLKIHWDDTSLTWDDWAMAIRYYYARISLIDSQIGRLYNYLSENGLLDNTVIIFTADHGETLGSHGGLLDKGWHHFEETHRIPMIIRLPDGSTTGKEIPEFVSLVDVYPTVLDLAGEDQHEQKIHGRSLLPLIRGDEKNWRKTIVTEFLGLGNVGTCMKTLRCENLKYGCNLTGQDELYDLDRDPFETENLARDPEYAEDVSRMKQHLMQWMAETDDRALRMFKWREKISPEA